MGNSSSQGSRKFLDPEPSWQEYWVADWRSERVRELDRHGGPGRPPVARGDSVTAKLVFLEGALKHDQKRMKHVLQLPDEDSQKREQQVEKAQKPAQERLPDFMLNTDLRAYERQHLNEDTQVADVTSAQQRDFSLVMKDPEMRKKMMEQRKKMLEYAKRVNVTKGAPGIKQLNLPAIRSKVAASWKPEEGRVEEEGGGEASLWASPKPSEWRLRMHLARRRLVLLVRAIARWQVALSRRPGPKRLPRVNSFSYFIPQVLGPEAKRFIEEANAVAEIKADAVKSEEAAVESRLERMSPTDLWPSHLRHRPSQQKQRSVEAPAETPERSQRGVRGPLRRGQSDSGSAATTAAAAAAVTAVDAEAAGTLDDAASSGNGGGVSRPKRRPELRKLSGKGSSSLPDGVMSGHTSDVEGYPQTRRVLSGRVGGSTRLPLITSTRMSCSGVASTSTADSAPIAPRQPRAKLERISSSGHGHHAARMGRRQSDSSVAMAKMAAAAISAAAVAASSAAAGSGSGYLAPRRASAAIVPRVSGAGVSGRARGSDYGSMVRQPEGSEGAGTVAAASPVVSAADAAVVSGGDNQQWTPNGLAVAALPSPRRSDTGQLLALANVGSVQSPDSPRNGGGGGFLPRISSSGGGAGGACPSPPSVPKPISMPQARRFVLLAEASHVATGVEEGVAGRGGNAASSPSRLGPMKAANGATRGGSAAGRSPDRASISGGSILDALRQSREGAVLPLAAGGIRELREALAAGGGANGLGLAALVGSPLHSSGTRSLTVSIDASMLLSPNLAATASLASQLSPSTVSSPARSTNLNGASNLPATAPHLPPLTPPLTTTPPLRYAPSLTADNANGGEDLQPVSPTAVPLSLALGPVPTLLRPLLASAQDSPPAASTSSSISAVVPLPSSISISSSSVGATASCTSSATILSNTTSCTTSTSSTSVAATTSVTSPTPTAVGITSTAAESDSPAVGGGGGCGPTTCPSSKPPLGPTGTFERVRSGRSTHSATPTPTTNNNPSAASTHPPSPPSPSPTCPTPATTLSPTEPAPEPPSLSLDPKAAARLARSQQLMGMYANRVNATWAESQQWRPPAVVSVQEQEQFCTSDAWVPYKVTALRMLKAGLIGVHIDACADAVQLPDGTSMDIWTSDPWVVAQRLRPGSLPLSERIEGLSLGARALQQLVLSLESLAGKDAVPRLTVVLAINDDQRNAVVADIIRTRAYGLKPENLILTAQRKRCGYRYDRDAQAFLEDPSTSAQVLGSGYSLCQLAWLGDAFCVTSDGELDMLMGRTLLERFAEARVEWLVGRRARDLSLLSPCGVLDLQQLAFALYAADRHSGNMVMQAAPAASLTIPRAYDSMLLALEKRPGSAAVGCPRTASVAASAAGVQGGGGVANVVDLRSAELSSPMMVEALAAVRRLCGHDGWVGLQRYLLHIPTLHAMLNTLGIFRPKLTMSGEVARLSLDAADITADLRVAAVAVQTRTSPAILTCPNEVDDLIPLLLAQDHSAAFRDIIATSGPASARESVSGGGGGGGGASSVSIIRLSSKPGIRILLFVAANEVTQLAVNLALLMARPGRDVVTLVTVVHSNLQMTSGQGLLLTYLKQISNAMIEAHSEVLVKGGNGLLDVMESAVGRLAPQLVVMASAALTLANLNTASVMGSVTLSVLKRLSLPVAVATANSKNLVLTQRRTAFRCMVLVEPTSRPALSFLCTCCMEPLRGDRLVLAGHHPTRQMTTQQQQVQRRLTDNFADISSSHRFHMPGKLQLDGPVDKALIAASEEEAVHLVGLQVPLGTKGVPGHVLGLIRACRGAVLVYRDTAVATATSAATLTT